MSGGIEQREIDTLKHIVERDQVWPRMAAKWGVDNPVPPWKTSLDGLCDALDRAACDADIPSFKERRDEEDLLSATVYADLPYPENQHDFEKLISAARRAHRFHHRRKPGVLRIAGGDKIRADVRPAFKLLPTALVTFAVKIAARTALAAIETTSPGRWTIAMRLRLKMLAIATGRSRGARRRGGRRSCGLVE